MLVLRSNKPFLDQNVLNNNLGVVLTREDTPSFQNTFEDGVYTALGGGEFIGNTTMQDGFLQSSNYDGTSGTGGTTGWFLGPSLVDLPTVEAQELHIPDQTTANSMHVETDGDTYWGANVATGFANAPASVSKAGVGKFTDVVITGGSIDGVPISGIPNDSTTDIALLDLSHDLVFSVTDADTIAWGAGTITMSNGRAFSIDAGNTGNMAAFTYIYLDPGTSATVLQVTTTAATAIGADKRLIGTAQNETTTASFVPYGPGKPLIDGDNIGALSIVAANMAANSIVAGSINVTDLAAINVDAGSITAGTFTGTTVRTASSGTRFQMTSTAFQGINSVGTTIFEVVVDGANAGDVIMGDDATDSYAHWDNSAGTFKVFTDNAVSFSGDGSDGDVTISGSTTLTQDMFYSNLTVTATGTLNTAGFRVFVQSLFTKDSGGIVRNNGNVGGDASTVTPGTAGAAASGVSLPTGVVGVAGAAGRTTNGAGTVGVAGSSINRGSGVDGVTGSTAGGTNSHVGGAAGAAGTRSNSVNNIPRDYRSSYNLFDFTSETAVQQILTSAASGSGGSGGHEIPTDGTSGAGGGSGSPGGYVWISAQKMSIAGTGEIQSIGGDGGAGGDAVDGSGGSNRAAGGGAGGSAGSGGVIFLLYLEKTGSGTTDVTGGSGGAGGSGVSVGTLIGGDGGAGGAGSAGSSIEIQM